MNTTAKVHAVWGGVGPYLSGNFKHQRVALELYWAAFRCAAHDILHPVPGGECGEHDNVLDTREALVVVVTSFLVVLRSC